MMYALGLVGMVATLFASFVSMSVARYVMARVLGIRGVGLVSAAPPESVAARAVVGILMASAVATYGLAATLYATGIFVGGKSTFGTIVNVLPGRVAAEAGLQNGDRVVTIAGQKMETWEAIAAAIKAHAGQPTEITVARGEAEVRISVTPSPEGKIGIAAAPIAVDIPVMEAIGSGIAAPVSFVVEIARNVGNAFSARPPEPVSGPVGIAREVATQSARVRSAFVFNLLGTTATYAWLPAALLSLRGLTGRRAPAKRSR